MGGRLLVWLVLTSSLLTAVLGARILGVFPFPSRSHVVIYSTLLKELAARGHEVTVFSDYPLLTPVPNYTDVKLDLDKNVLAGMTENQSLFTLGNSNPFLTTIISHLIVSSFSHQTFKHKELQKLIASKDKKFDLVFISEFSNEAFAGLAHKFDAPIIYISPIVDFPWTNGLVGTPSLDSFVPSIYSKYSDHMTFRERLENTVYNTFARVFHALYHIPRQDKLMREYFQDSDNLPHVSEINRRTALLFTYAMPGINYPQPLQPNVIQIGGMHLKPAKPLPKELHVPAFSSNWENIMNIAAMWHQIIDLKNVLDDAKEGVIYFSMGSNLRSAEFPEEKRNALIKAFSKLKEKVLWKFEEDHLPGQPDNLKISKWFPQNDILAHQNVKLFITHGGILSTQEAVYHGVPVLGIPIFGDQEFNMKLLEELGCGLRIKFSDINEASIEWVLQEAITNPSYGERAKAVSRIFRDQPQSPLERGVFWTEYVLRHKGAAHLRSAALDLAWYQYLLLDVVAVLVLLPAALVYCILLLCRRLFCAKKKISVSQAKKKK